MVPDRVQVLARRGQSKERAVEDNCFTVPPFLKHQVFFYNQQAIYRSVSTFYQEGIFCGRSFTLGWHQAQKGSG